MHVFLFLESSRATYRDIWQKSSEFQIPHCHILKMNENESTQNQSEVHDPEGALMEVKKILKNPRGDAHHLVYTCMFNKTKKCPGAHMGHLASADQRKQRLVGL